MDVSSDLMLEFGTFELIAVEHARNASCHLEASAPQTLSSSVPNINVENLFVQRRSNPCRVNLQAGACDLLKFSEH